MHPLIPIYQSPEALASDSNPPTHPPTYLSLPPFPSLHTMDQLRRLTPASLPAVRARLREQKTTFTTGVVVGALLWWGVRDYREFLALGPGGVPYNVLGWAAITLLIRPFALSKAAATRTADYPPAAEAHADVAALPPRAGPRARVGGIAPHRQLSQHPPESMREVSESSFVSQCFLFFFSWWPTTGG